MSEEQTDRIEDILPRYCEGKADREERKRVEAWIQESDEHYKMARQMQLIYLASDSLSVMDLVNTDRALEKVNSRIRRSQLGRFFVWGQMVAAILFIPLLVTCLIQWQGTKKQDVRMLEVRTNPGMTTSLTLSDGTKVNLNSESTLKYPEYFEGNTRLVQLSGEAFFEVSKNPKKRFVIDAPHHTQVEVHGTSFNIEAFERDPFVSTTLLTGEVAFISQGGKLNMEPGEKLVYNSHTNRSHIYRTNGEVETSWKDGMIIFRKTPFEEALRMLTKRYNVDFVVSNTRYKEDSFTGSFTNHRLEQILEIFKISSGIRWRYIPIGDEPDSRIKIEII